MVHLNSICAGALARQAIADMKKSKHHLGQAYLCRMWLNIRLCTQHGKPSGGAVLECRADKLPHEDRDIIRQKRLGKSDETTLYRHAADLVEIVRRMTSDPIRQLREQVYQAAELKGIDGDKAESTGRETDYSKMNEEDCKFWLQWIDKEV